MILQCQGVSLGALVVVVGCFMLTRMSMSLLLNSYSTVDRAIEMCISVSVSIMLSSR